MDNPLKTFDPAVEERASLYVLELLPPPECRDFERRLQQDPSLRELVRDLQGNLDALALGDSVRPASVPVWGRIAAEVNASSAAVLAFPTRTGRWLPRLLAAAACLVVGGFLHSWLAPAPGAPPSAAQDPKTAAAVLRPPVVAIPGVPLRSSTVPIPPAAITAAPAARTNPVTAPELEHLRERVRVLASQVSALNQVLTQQVSLPSGFTRLHVFRLMNTNGFNSQRIGAAAPELTDALAALAAGRRSSTTGEPEDPTTGNPTGPPTENPASSPSELIASTAGLPLNGGQPLGFFDPETGRGAIALFEETLAENQNFVVWAQTTGADGNPLLQDVGTMPAGGYPTVISFNAPANAQSTPVFFVTLEPVGADAPTTPTGPVVAAPPANNP
ncbi:MAG TPA: hypothetical protein PLX89_25740 [Verrucomicrobiota bacterium]|nr:hypothetical protein [Verrucomicrobiales bacterium]HRI16410.1 hypothetical protein [Verrucomicrobiota bacterium]